MKKKFSVVFLVALMIASLFVSCDNGIKSSDPKAMVHFVDSDSLERGLNSSSPEFDATKLYWTYEAQKMDNSGLKTGETRGPVAVSKTGKAGLGESVGPFSLGSWKFTLHAHETSAAGPEVYVGTVSNVVITSGTTNTVNVKVHALQEGNGTVIIADDITLHDAKGNPIDKYVENIIFARASEPEVPVEIIPDGRSYTVPAGAWKVTIEYLCPENHDIAYGRNSIYVTVSANQTITISGTLEEITGTADFETTADGGYRVVQPETVAFAPAKQGDTAFADKQVMDIEVATTPVLSEKPSPETPVEKKTVVTIPSTAVTQSSGEAKLDVTAYSAATAGKKFTVSADQNVVSALDLKLTIENQTVTEFSDPIRVVTYIPTGLANVNVIYNGDGKQPTSVDYDPETGKLTFMTTHFSAYCVVGETATASGWGASPDEGEIYLIHDASELKAFRDKVNAGDFEDKKVRLASDIYLLDEPWQPIGTTNRKATEGFYNGEFDGAGFKIHGLHIAPDVDVDDSVYGLFGVVGNAVIRNVTIESGYVRNTVDTAAGIVGAVLGTTTDARIENCVNRATCEGQSTSSGILGRAYNTGKLTVSNCINEGTIKGPDKVAGIVGINVKTSDLTITGCKNVGDIISTETAAGDYLGGIIGFVNGKTLTIENCLNTGRIDAHSLGGGIAGHIASEKNLLVKGCANSGEVSGGDVGGILGSASLSSAFTFVDCSNSGYIHADGPYCIPNDSKIGYTAGGIIGRSRGTGDNEKNIAFTDCSNTGRVASKNWAGGIAGLLMKGDYTLKNCSGGSAAIECVSEPYSDAPHHIYGYEPNWVAGRLIGATVPDDGYRGELNLYIDDSNSDAADIPSIGGLLTVSVDRRDSMPVNVKSGTFHGLPLLALDPEAKPGYKLFQGHFFFDVGTAWDGLESGKKDHAEVTEYTLVTGSKEPMSPAFSVWDSSAASYAWYNEPASSDHYEIRYASELVGLERIVNGYTLPKGIVQDSFKGKTIKLVGDIDLADLYFRTIGTKANAADGSVKGHAFCGTFDGNGHTIRNLKVTSPWDDNLKLNPNSVGLFANLEGGHVKNLTVDGHVAATNAFKNGVGMIVGCMTDGATVTGCTVTGTVKGLDAQAVAGKVAEGCSVADCIVEGCTVTQIQ